MLMKSKMRIFKQCKHLSPHSKICFEEKKIKTRCLWLVTDLSLTFTLIYFLFYFFNDKLSYFIYGKLPQWEDYEKCRSCA